MSETASTKSPERYRRIGRTDIVVSSVCMGCWAIVGDSTWGPQDLKDAEDAIRTALDVGITFFDTAEGYGRGASEELLGRVLSGRRDQVIIGTKVSAGNARSWERLEAACSGSLRRLRTDYIDVYHLHWPCRDVPIADIVEWFGRLQEQGRIRSFAVSNFGVGDLSDLLAVGRCEANQLPYSLLWRVIEDEIAPLCRQHDISITCYSPLAQGLLTGKFRSADDVPEGRARTRHFSCNRPQARHREPGCEKETFEAVAAVRRVCEGIGRPMAEVALAWLLHQPGVTSVIAGARNPDQVRQNARAMDLRLDEDVLRDLDVATRPLKKFFGRNPDMWQTDSRYR